ncbi:MAG: hypothetical protein MUO17_05245 [Dehalococcoidales bacterium]|nr:hypothetical protein [Dehalococcoidales bacterium]
MQRSKKFILAAILMAAVLSGSVLAISCSSAGDGELPSAPQGTGPEGDMPPVPGLNDDLLAGVAEILGIDQQELADAFAQLHFSFAQPQLVLGFSYLPRLAPFALP